MKNGLSRRQLAPQFALVGAVLLAPGLVLAQNSCYGVHARLQSRAIQLITQFPETSEFKIASAQVHSVLSNMLDQAKASGLSVPSQVTVYIVHLDNPSRKASGLAGAIDMVLEIGSDPRALQNLQYMAAHELGHMIVTANLGGQFSGLQTFYQTNASQFGAWSLTRSGQLARQMKNNQAWISEQDVQIAAASNANDVALVKKLKDEATMRVIENVKIFNQRLELENKLAGIQRQFDALSQKEKMILAIVGGYTELFADFLTEIHFQSDGNLTARFVSELGLVTQERDFARVRELPPAVSEKSEGPVKRDVHEMTGLTRSYLWNELLQSPKIAGQPMRAVKILFQAITAELDYFSNQVPGTFQTTRTEQINQRLIQRLRDLSL